MASKDKPVIKSFVNKRTFKYEKDGISLDFTLKTDNSKDLRTFKSLLEAGIADIDEVLKGMKN